MIMKKTTQTSILLILLLIRLCQSSHQVRAVEATLPHLVAAVPPSQFLHSPGPPPMPAFPSPPCGSNIGSQVTALRENRCRQIPRPPKTQKKKIPRHPAAIP